MKRGKYFILNILFLFILSINLISGQTDIITRCINEPIWISNFYAPCEQSHPLNACYIEVNDRCFRRKIYSDALHCVIFELNLIGEDIERSDIELLLNEYGAKNCCPSNFNVGPESQYNKATYEEGNLCCDNMNRQQEGQPGRYEFRNINKISRAFTGQTEDCCYERKPVYIQPFLREDNSDAWEWDEAAKIIKIKNQMCCTVSVLADTGNPARNQITKAVNKDEGDNSCCPYSPSRISSSMTNIQVAAFNNLIERCCQDLGVVKLNDPKHCGGCNIRCKKSHDDSATCSLRNGNEYYCVWGICDPINHPELCV